VRNKFLSKISLKQLEDVGRIHNIALVTGKALHDSNKNRILKTNDKPNFY